MAKSLKDLASQIGSSLFRATPVGQVYNASQKALTNLPDPRQYVSNLMGSAGGFVRQNPTPNTYFANKIAPPIQSPTSQSFQSFSGPLGNLRTNFNILANPQTAPDVRRDFQIGMQQKDAGQPNYLQPIRQFVANSAISQTGGIRDITSGITRAQQGGLFNPTVGAFQAVRGISKIVAPATPFGLFANASSGLPDKAGIAQRFAGGMVQGVTGEDTTAGNVKFKEMGVKLPKVLGGRVQFDPAKVVGSMVGYVNQPQNKLLFHLTNKLLPGSTTLKDFFTKTNIASTVVRGGVENFILNLPDMPEKLTPMEKAQWLTTTFGVGAAQELGGQFVMQGTGDVAKYLKNTKVANAVFDSLKEFKRKATVTVNGDIDPKTGKRRVMQMWQYILRNQRGFIDLSAEVGNSKGKKGTEGLDQRSIQPGEEGKLQEPIPGLRSGQSVSPETQTSSSTIPQVANGRLGDVSGKTVSLVQEAKNAASPEEFAKRLKGKTIRVSIDELRPSMGEAASNRPGGGTTSYSKGPIEVSASPYNDSPAFVIDDGNHRYREAIARGEKTVEVKVSETADELTKYWQKIQGTHKNVGGYWQKVDVAQPPLTDVNTPENIKWFSGLQADMEKLKRSNFIESLPKDKSGKFTVDPEKELSKLLGNFNKKYGTNITREDFLSGNLPERNDLLLNRINPNIAPQPPVSDIPSTGGEIKGFTPDELAHIRTSINENLEFRDIGSNWEGNIQNKINNLVRRLGSIEKAKKYLGIEGEIGKGGVSLNTQNQTNFVPSKTEKNLGMEGQARGVALNQNTGVVGQPANLQENSPKLLSGSTEPLTVKDAKRIFKKTGEIQPFVNTLKPSGKTIITPPTSGAYTAQATPKTLEKIRVRDIKAQERAAKAEFDAWQRQYREKTVSPLERVKAVEQSIKSNTSSPVSKDPEALKDISGWQAYMRDVYRNFKAVYGDRFDEAKRIMLDPLDRSKGQYVDMTENWAKKLKTDIVERFNIRKGSKESAAVQQYGEGILSDSDLVTQFGAKKAQEIKAADQWFRLAYDELINTVNAVRKRIYPNNPEKWVAKRQDYYRHFREMKEGLGALFNIFDTPSNISSTLAGISEGTKPKAKFLSIAQQRKGERTTYDAVGGFIDYIKQASYATNIDPHIERFRNLSKELGESTAESKNLNTFVSYLSRFADDLSGKTNAADRFAQEIIPGGRTTFRAINWLNNRVKSNAVIGNASSALSQIMNVPQGIADAGVPSAIKGIGRTLAGIFMDSPVVKRSTFLRERYSDPFSQFDTGIINDVGKFAKWMTGVLDKVGSNVIWNSQYEKALSLGVKDAVKFADDATRSLVAGRGIGEVPLLQKARVMQLVAPFQLEVQNLWWVLKDMKDQRAFGKIATFFVVNHLMNKAIEGIRGSDVTFDPIQSVMDGYKSFQEEEDKTKGAIKFAGRQAGEVLSNVPFGQTIASLYPEYGATIGDTKLPTRRDLFGKGNPVRQGSGLLAVEGLKDPLYKIIPPYGGAQLKKTIEGLQSVGRGFVGKPDAIKYPVEQSAGNVVRGAVFGKGALPETRTYYDEDRRPLGEKQSAVYLASSDKQNAYKTVIDKRKEDALDEKAKEELKFRGGGSLEKNGKIYLLKDNGDVNTIDPSFQPKKPILTGQKELDKKLISKFNGQITSKANDIVELYEAGKLSQQEAEKQLDALKALKSSYSTKKSGSAKKISIKKITPKTIRVSMPKASKIQTIKVPKAPSFKKSTSRKAIKITAGKPIKITKLKGLTVGKKLV